jgi:hypothetical protein
MKTHYVASPALTVEAVSMTVRTKRLMIGSQWAPIRH